MMEFAGLSYHATYLGREQMKEIKHTFPLGRVPVLELDGARDKLPPSTFFLFFCFLLLGVTEGGRHTPSVSSHEHATSLMLTCAQSDASSECQARIAQSASIVRYIAATTALMPEEHDEKAKVDMMFETVQELFGDKWFNTTALQQQHESGNGPYSFI